MRKTICLIDGPKGKGCANPPHDKKIITIEDVSFTFYYCDFHTYEANKLQSFAWTRRLLEEVI